MFTILKALQRIYIQQKETQHRIILNLYCIKLHKMLNKYVSIKIKKNHKILKEKPNPQKTQE